MTMYKGLEQDEARRKLIWANAEQQKGMPNACPIPSLDWILQRKEHFKIGELVKKAPGKYYYPINDVLHGQCRAYIQEIPEEQLRKDDFLLNEIRGANEKYEASVREKKAQKERKRKRRTRGLAKVVAGSLIAGGAIFGGRAAYNEYNSPENVAARAEARIREKKRIEVEKREKERLKRLDKMAVSLVHKLGGGLPLIYKLENGEIIVVDKGAMPHESSWRLMINYNINERFISERWKRFPSNDAVNVEFYCSKKDGKWQTYKGKNIPQEKRSQYQSLIEKIADAMAQEK